MLEYSIMVPLAEQLRPQTLAEVTGQQHLVGEEGVITKIFQSGQLPSLILWGPPGVGKTTIAKLIAKDFGLKFIELSGVSFSTKQLADLSEEKPRTAEETQYLSNLFDSEDKRQRKPWLVFVDEIHRLNKSQQAQFLPKVEKGEWILIGATTENPSFEVISPLLSRCQVLLLNALAPEDLAELAARALKKLNWDTGMESKAVEYVVQAANGDGRQLINFVEALHGYFKLSNKQITLAQVSGVLGKLHLVYDKGGEEHYNLISALHKSMRGSDANAAIYYLGRMLEGGEDPLYIVRRCVRFAAEDIGNANPEALILANAAFQATERVGMPEANVIIAQLVIYLAKSPKSNEAYIAYKQVQQDIAEHGNLPVPLKLRNAPTKFMKDIGYGNEYKYAHDFDPEELKEEQYLPDKLKNRKYIKTNTN